MDVLKEGAQKLLMALKGSIAAPKLWRGMQVFVSDWLPAT